MSNNKWILYSNAINECYQEILNRPADRSGITTYMRQITRGWSKEDIKRDLMKSDEAKKVNNSLNNTIIDLEPEPEPEPEPESKIIKKSVDPIILIVKSHETDKLNDLEYFNYLQKDVINYWKSLEENSINKDEYLKLIGEAVIERWRETSSINSFAYKVNKGLLQNIESQFLFSVNKEKYDSFWVKNTNKSDHYQIYLRDSNRNKVYLKIDSINLTNTIINNYNGCIIEKRNLSSDRSQATSFEKTYIDDSKKYCLRVVSGIGIDSMLLAIPGKKNEIGINKYLCIDADNNTLKLVDFSTLHNSNNNYIHTFIDS